jgi:hypothetical protein
MCSLRDCNEVPFIYELAQSDNCFHLSNGWGVFLSHGGVIEGDYISFEIRSVDDTVATVFAADGRQRKPIIDRNDAANKTSCKGDASQFTLFFFVS